MLLADRARLGVPRYRFFSKARRTFTEAVDGPSWCRVHKFAPDIADPSQYSHLRHLHMHMAAHVNYPVISQSQQWSAGTGRTVPRKMGPRKIFHCKTNPIYVRAVPVIQHALERIPQGCTAAVPKLLKTLEQRRVTEECIKIVSMSYKRNTLKRAQGGSVMSC
jgi:hypothetical protein